MVESVDVPNDVLELWYFVRLIAPRGFWGLLVVACLMVSIGFTTWKRDSTSAWLWLHIAWFAVGAEMMVTVIWSFQYISGNPPIQVVLMTAVMLALGTIILPGIATIIVFILIAVRKLDGERPLHPSIRLLFNLGLLIAAVDIAIVLFFLLVIADAAPYK